MQPCGERHLHATFVLITHRTLDTTECMLTCTTVPCFCTLERGDQCGGDRSAVLYTCVRAGGVGDGMHSHEARSSSDG